MYISIVTIDQQNTIKQLRVQNTKGRKMFLLNEKRTGGFS